MRFQTLGPVMLTAILMIAQGSLAQAVGSVNGLISDDVGASLGSAQILFHPDTRFDASHSTRKNVWVTAEVSGNYRAQLQGGFWDMCVMMPAFTAVCTKIQIKPDRRINRNIRMKVDPLISPLLADTVK